VNAELGDSELGYSYSYSELDCSELGYSELGER
jgi:hypothetical protein